MEIRNTTEIDLDSVMEIYAHARAFMAAHGNPRQWGRTGWPPEELIRRDIHAQKSYVCSDGGIVRAVFFYDFGADIEPTYRILECGSWAEESPYGVVHRIASDGAVKGTGSFCIRWALDRSGHLRMDTHPDNLVMQRLLTGLGFEKRGIIHVEEDNDPRFAYEIIRRS